MGERGRRQDQERSTSQKSNSGRPKRNSAVCRSAAHEAIGADATLVSQFKRTFVEIIRFIFELIRLRASFTISWRKPSFGIKIVLSGFTEDVQWLISAEKAWIYYSYFCAWPYKICISRSFPLRRENYGRKVFKLNHAMRFSNVCASQITDIFTINAPKKHILNCFAPEMAAITVARRKHREQRARGRRQRIFFHTYLFIWNSRRTHDADIPFGKPCYFELASGNKRRLGVLN